MIVPVLGANAMSSIIFCKPGVMRTLMSFVIGATVTRVPVSGRLLVSSPGVTFVIMAWLVTLSRASYSVPLLPTLMSMLSSMIHFFIFGSCKTIWFRSFKGPDFVPPS